MIAKLKKQGWKSGFPDIIVFLPEKPIFIEMKRTKGGRVSEAQEEWHRILDTLEYDVYVCKGALDAISCIKQYF